MTAYTGIQSLKRPDPGLSVENDETIVTYQAILFSNTADIYGNYKGIFSIIMDKFGLSDQYTDQYKLFCDGKGLPD